MTALNSRGEVADVLNVNQFVGGHSAYECVAYCAALAKYAGPPGQGPTSSASDASNLAQAWYAQEEGSNLASNTNGMGLDEEYDMLSGIGLHYQALPATIQAIKEQLQRGYLVLVCGAETGMWDLDLGRVPYSWPPSGNHCILATGIASDGNLLVHDCASIAPDGVRPGPRRYDAGRMQLVSSTAVAAPWQGGFMKVPEGWTLSPDGKTLTAPNHIQVSLGFCEHILNFPGGWDPDDWPLEAETHCDPLEQSNPSLGPGQKMCCKKRILEWTPSRGVFEAWGGQEVLKLRQLLAQAQTPPPAQIPASVISDLEALLQENKDKLTGILNALGVHS